MSADATAALTEQEDQRVRQASWLMLVLLCSAQLLTVIDGTVVNVALPTISRALAFSPGAVQWVVTSYLLCTGGIMLLAGRSADRFGRRRLLLAGVAVFTAASLASGLATAPGMLIAARALQGAGAALLSPAALSVITTSTAGAQRARALSVWGAIGAGGFVAGLLFGGAITTELGWRWVFFINVPVGAVILSLVPVLVTRDTGSGSGPSPRLPLASAAALTAGLVALVYAVSGLHGWGSPQTLVPAAAGVVLLAVFAVLDRRSEHPMMVGALLRTRSLVAGSLLMLAVTGLLGGTLFVATFFIEQETGASPLRTGLEYVPFALVIGLAAHVGPHLLARFGSRVVACAALLAIAAGALLLAGTGTGSGYAGGLLPAFLLLGVGTGLALVSASVAAMAEVGPAHAGAASGLLMTGHEAGGALGVAVLSAVATAAGHGATSARIPSGHHAAFLVAAAIALGLAVLAGLTVPAIRPQPGTGHRMVH